MAALKGLIDTDAEPPPSDAEYLASVLLLGHRGHRHRRALDRHRLIPAPRGLAATVAIVNRTPTETLADLVNIGLQRDSRALNGIIQAIWPLMHGAAVSLRHGHTAGTVQASGIRHRWRGLPEC